MKKLTDDQVSEIRTAHDKYRQIKREADQLSVAALAEKFEVSEWAIMRAISERYTGKPPMTLTDADVDLLRLASEERSRLLEAAKPFGPKGIADRLGMNLDYVRKIIHGLERA